MLINLPSHGHVWEVWNKVLQSEWTSNIYRPVDKLSIFGETSKMNARHKSKEKAELEDILKKNPERLQFPASGPKSLYPCEKVQIT